ncbi:MAG TPA: AlkA N-terminal domain-containing protein [Burkholderiales bacterium]
MAVRIRELRPRPPFRLELVAWALRRRAHNTIDRWDGSTYSRTFEHRGMPVHAALTQPTPTRLRLSLSAERLDAALERSLVGVLDRMLGLSVDLDAFHDFAARDRRLAPLAARFRGLKPVRFPSVFEALANAIACQQLSLEAGIALLNRLVAGPGAPFPSPARLARMPVAALRAKGFSTQKARALGAIARAAARHELDAESFAPLDDAAACERLEALPGIGRWSAEYVLLRGLGRLHVFPGDDVGARNNLQRWLRLRRPLDYARVAQVLAPWQPWAGLVYFHLLLESLARAGHLRA